ncbi:hypothetical protein BpHYR1_002899 [Brachionus plicatilis]|uniref:Uncharacterized protein n=1 Tax=Brachionus plicatilis TaxID=10195 RepID=A0A3M7QBU8_BRAPC|nr:hypothetical protein BpHYR1_002899 [Brachionus plicatilis]
MTTRPTLNSDIRNMLRLKLAKQVRLHWNFLVMQLNVKTRRTKKIKTRAPLFNNKNILLLNINFGIMSKITVENVIKAASKEIDFFIEKNLTFGI